MIKSHDKKKSNTNVAFQIIMMWNTGKAHAVIFHFCHSKAQSKEEILRMRNLPASFCGGCVYYSI